MVEMNEGMKVARRLCEEEDAQTCWEENKQTLIQKNTKR